MQFNHAKNSILLLLWCTILATNTTSTDIATPRVPLVLSDTKVPNVATRLPLATQIPKVPNDNDASETTAFLQTPTSVFFSNYNSQQNVIALVRNIDRRLNNIRNAEMRIAKIQEIFDSMQFNGHVPATPFINAFRKNFTSDAKARVSSTISDDLRLFSKRLSRKLQKATNIVYELKDFLRYNISTLMLQHPSNAYNDEDDFEPDLDFEIDDTESISGQLPNDNMQEVHLYLNTYIENLQKNIELHDHQLDSPLHYNKQQIQILNYLKTDGEYAEVHALPPALYYENNVRSLEANNLIADKIHRIKASLTMKTESNNIAGGGYTSNAANTKLRGLSISSHFKHVFFLSRSDHATGHGNGYFSNLHFRQLYVSAIKQKFVFLLLDVGSAMNSDLLELSKIFVQNVLQLLTDTDQISVMSVSNETQTMILDDTLQTHGVYYATRTRKDEVINNINSLIITKAHTNHSLAFEDAFKHLEFLRNSSLLTTANPVEFVYVTRGFLTNLSDAMHVLNVIANGQQHQLEPIIINTCGVVLDEKRLMYEKQFLSDIAMQNYTKYDIKVNDWYKTNLNNDEKGNSNERTDYLRGKFFVLTKGDLSKLIHASTAVFESLFEERFLMQSLYVHQPFLDERNNEVLVSMTHAVSPFGVVGVNLYLADLLEDIVTYGETVSNKYEHLYAFLIDRNGVTIAHPAFPRPFAQSPAAFPVDIGFLENSTDFINIRRKILQNENGEISTTIYVDNDKPNELMTRTYHWQSILGIYVICLVTTTKKEPSIKPTIATAKLNSTNKSTQHGNTNLPLILQRFNIKENIVPPQLPPNLVQSYDDSDNTYVSSLDLVYHRLDLLPTKSFSNNAGAQNQSPHIKICRYFRQVATMDAATLFLSSTAFESPFTFLYNSRTSDAYAQARIVESITAYIKDTTGLLANPGLLPQIRQEINILYNAMQYLKKRHQDARGTLKSYILRRYVATVSGVLQVYPGCLLSDNYDATRRPWFRKAMQHPGKIVSTEPYLDAGGAGYIISLAHTIFEGKSNALHSAERDEPVAVVALDLPYAFFYKMILDTTSLCQQQNMKCLLFDNEGFLIAHPSMLEASSSLKNVRRPHEHLTHKESYLANDILNHKTLVRKLGCANYQNRTLQRYYSFNTSLAEILTNVVHGERTKYALTNIRGSNIFAAVLNSSCDGGAFCPCSTIDRVCLNCNRMDQMDCECPCECPIEGEVFDIDENTTNFDETPTEIFFSNYTQQFPYCEPPTENFIAYPNTLTDQILPPCVNINCDIYSTQGECLAIMGCEWCQQDLDGNSFGIAFCTSQSMCFNGVLSSINPYGDLEDLDLMAAHGFNPGQKNNSYSALGPVGGAIVVLGIVIGFAIYCYRHNLDAHTQDQFYIDSMQEENYGLPLSRFNFDDCQANDEPLGGNGGYDHPAAQRNLIHPADISPYHVSTGSSYRRPPNGESDNGYSTMTPHEDSSDHQCFTLAEPLLLHDKRHSKSDTMSISTSISSPTNRQQQSHQPPYPLTQTHTQTALKDGRHNHITSPKKLYNASSPARVYEQTTLPLHSTGQTEITQIGSSPHCILAPVTVHRHMETSES